MAELAVEDEASFRSMPEYAALKGCLDGYRFRCLEGADRGRWDRAVFLNLTFWDGAGGDVLVDESLTADVVVHVAWHRLAARALGKTRSADAMFFGEAVASAYDLCWIGRLLGRKKRSTCLESQVSAMAEVTDAAGLSARGFSSLLADVAADPAQAFADLRALLFTASTALVKAKSAEAALKTLSGFDDHRFAPLLHHYNLSSWILYARAYAPNDLALVPSIRALDRRLRREPALELLLRDWL